MTATLTTTLPFRVGDFGGRIQLTIRDQSGNLVTMTGTCSFLFDGVVIGTKAATIQSTGIAYWVITNGFFTRAGNGKVRAQINQSGASAQFTSEWVDFPVQT